MKKNILFLFLYSLILHSNCLAITRSNKVLIAINSTTGEKKIIKQDTKINILTNTNGRVVAYKGRFKIINNQYITIDKYKVDVSKINYMKPVHLISGSFITMFGIVGITMGGLIYTTGKGSKNSITQLSTFIIGGGILIIGAIVTAVGQSIKHSNNKSNSFEKWTVSITEKSLVN